MHLKHDKPTRRTSKFTGGSMQNKTIEVLAKFTWVEVLQISPARLLQYKNDGIPSERCDPMSWEKYINDLEAKSESSGSMQYAETTEVVISSVDRSNNESKLLNVENFKLMEFPPRMDYQEGKNYLIRVQSTPGVTYSKKITAEYESEKLTFEVKPECLPGGQIIRTLIGRYDGLMFEYPRDCYQYTESATYLVDAKGRKIQIKEMEESVSDASSIQTLFSDKDLTDWYEANIQPVRQGTYEIEAAEKGTWPSPALRYAKWNGALWVNDFGVPITIRQWRGLKNPT